MMIDFVVMAAKLRINEIKAKNILAFPREAKEGGGLWRRQNRRIRRNKASQRGKGEVER
jgi:hypothetical protein